MDLSEITTYEWFTDSLCIERNYKFIERDKKIKLRYLKVKDNEDFQLFFAFYSDDQPIDYLDNEDLKNYKLPTYKYNEEGDWVERIIPKGKNKTIRHITYY